MEILPVVTTNFKLTDVIRIIDHLKPDGTICIGTLGTILSLLKDGSPGRMICRSCGSQEVKHQA